VGGKKMKILKILFILLLMGLILACNLTGGGVNPTETAVPTGTVDYFKAGSETATVQAFLTKPPPTFTGEEIQEICPSDRDPENMSEVFACGALTATAAPQ
jgi:hypothetical protein